MRENRPYGSEGGEQRYCSPTPIGICAHGAPLLAWIPASAGTTMSLSLGKLQAPGFFAILRVSRMPYRPPDLRSFGVLCYQIAMNLFSVRYWFWFYYGFRSHWRKG